MPGVPRSQACQACKTRRRKCDFAWPTCGPCRRTGTNCAGPTSLVKFVYGGNHGASKAEPLQTAPSGKDPTPKDVYAPYRRFRLGGPRPNPITSADRVASRLINSLEKDVRLIFLFTEGYLQSMPARLSQSSCLVDAANLFCMAYEDHRRHLIRGSTATLKQYGKVLRAVHRTIKEGKTQNVETLAGITLMSRSETLFGILPGPFRSVHAEVIVNVTRFLGPPKDDDYFYLGVVMDSLEEIGNYYFMRGEESFLYSGPWKDTLLNLPNVIPSLQFYSRETYNDFLEIYHKTPNFLAKLQEVHQDPHSPRMQLRATKIQTNLPVVQKRMQESLDESLGRSLKLGYASERIDPECLGGKCYDLHLGYFSGGIMYMFATLLAGIARILYDLNVLYDLPDSSSLWAKYRAACEQTWRFIPFQLEMDAACAPKNLTQLIITYAAGDQRERDFLLDMILKADESRHRFPRDRAELEKYVIASAKVMTGQLPIS